MRLSASAATVALAVFGVFCGLPVAAVAEEQSDVVTWSVRPSDGQQADDRAWVEHELEPGDTVSEHLVVTNHGDGAVAFQLSAADGYFTETGRFTMLPAGAPSTDAGAWIELAEQRIELNAGESRVVAFTLSVPEDATPGDHPAGVAASIILNSGGEISVDSRVGFRVMSRVGGELNSTIVADAAASYVGVLNPFEAGELTVRYSATNAGNTRLQVQPRITVAGPFGLWSQQINGESIAEIAPGEIREAGVVIRSLWPAFFYSVDVTADVAAVSADLDTGEIIVTSAEASAAAIPWSQLVVLLMIVALATAWNIDRRRKKQIIEQLTAQVRSEQ